MARAIRQEKEKKSKLERKKVKLSLFIDDIISGISITSNELPEKEMKKITPLKTASERAKYLGISLTKEVRCLYIRIYTVSLRKVEEALHTETPHVHGTEDLLWFRRQGAPEQSTTHFSSRETPAAFHKHGKAGCKAQENSRDTEQPTLS